MLGVMLVERKGVNLGGHARDTIENPEESFRVCIEDEVVEISMGQILSWTVEQRNVS